MTQNTNRLNKWIASLRELTSSLESAIEYRNVRAAFASEVGRQIMSTARIIQGKENHCVYGVWLDGHDKPIYIGQTMQAERRLWDLSIGESHHLANTFPPEIWHKVVILRWYDVLNESNLLKNPIIADIPKEVIGLSLEYVLQCKYKPLVNCNRRKRDGTWQEIDIAKSRSAGSIIAPRIESIYSKILDTWSDLSEKQASGQISISHAFGGVIFPSRILLARTDPISYQRSDE